MHGEKAEVLKSSDMNAASKKQKICAPEIEEGKGKTEPLEKDGLQETGNFHLQKSIVKFWFVFFAYGLCFFLSLFVPCLGDNPNVEDLKLAKESISEEHNSLMSLVKLTKSGLLLFTFPVENSPDTTNIVSRVFQSMESGVLKAPM